MSHLRNNKLKVYSASAGSGKTFTLAKEYLTICLSGNPDAYKNILAVTFTNKAANEMKAKILRFIKGFVESDNAGDVCQMKRDIIDTLGIDEQTLIARAGSLYQSLLHNYSDMAVCTIDSFVQRVSRSFAKELDLPNQYNIILDNDDLIDEILKRISDEIGSNDSFIKCVLTDFALNNISEELSWNLKKILGDFINKILSEDGFKYNQGLDKIDGSNYGDVHNKLKDKIRDFENEINTIVDGIEEEESDQNVSESDYKGNKTRGLPLIKAKMKKYVNNIVTPGIAKMLDEGDCFNSKSKLSDAAKDRIVEVYKCGISRYYQVLSKLIVVKSINRDYYLYVLRNQILQQINNFISESQQVHISEFNKRISNILGDYSVPFIYEKIGERYLNYFIDEFQDTSVLQWQNFLPLIVNSLSNGNMNLIVGDAKQSIYRFRGGEAEQIIKLPEIYKKQDNDFFNECERQFSEKVDKITLENNYRSFKNVVKFNNEFFFFAKNSLNEDDKKVYDDVKQNIQSSKGEGLVCVKLFKYKEDSTKDDYRAYVKNEMLKQIRQLKKDGINYKDITILVRSNSEGIEIADFLIENEIEVMSSESLLLKSSDRVQLIISALRFYIEDDNAVNKHALEYYISQTQVDNHTVTYTEDLKGIFNQAYSLYDTCIHLCRLFNLNILEDVFLQYFMNMVYEWQNGHNVGVTQFLEFWDKKSSKLSVRIDGELDCVNIMTIHKSKGLEFKVVMYPFANTSLKTTHGLTMSEQWEKIDKEDFDNNYFDSFLLRISKDELSNTKYYEHYETENRKTMLDILNIMYVAMTRAKEMLFIYSNDKKASSEVLCENLFTRFFDNSEKDIDLYSFENDDEFAYCTKNDVNKDSPQDGNLVVMLSDSNDNQEDKKSEDKNGVVFLELGKDAPSPRTLDWSENLKINPDPMMLWEEGNGFSPTEWGVLVHEILSKIKTVDDASEALQPYLNDGSIDDNQADKLLNIFKEIASVPCLREAYSSDAVVRNEMEIFFKDSILRLDRYAETKNGAFLIDYKTGRPYKIYYDKMKMYMGALKELKGNQSVKAYLVYLGEKTVVEEVTIDDI
ncbi:MAG: UvrD-helicase domain-containing protein [Candidatus Limimorpha sp.]